MPNIKKGVVGTDECMSFILEKLHEKGEILESHCYGHGFGERRVAKTIVELREEGYLEFRMKTEGQKVPIYRFSEKGRELYCLNTMFRDFAAKGEIDLEDELGSEFMDKLKVRYFGEE